MLKITIREANVVSGPVVPVDCFIDNCGAWDDEIQEAAIASGNPVAWMNYSWEETCGAFFEHVVKTSGWSELIELLACFWGDEIKYPVVLFGNETSLLLELKFEDNNFFIGFEMEA